MQRTLFLLLLFLLSSVGEQTIALNGKIVFETNRDGNDEIYVMDTDGGNQRRLTHHPGLDRYPDWPPDGSQIAFDSTRNGRRGSIFVMDVDAGILFSEPSLAMAIVADCAEEVDLSEPGPIGIAKIVF